MDISALSNVTAAAQALSGLIMVSPQKTIGYQPQALPGDDGQPQPQPKALLFNYEGEQALSLRADITDHWAEDNKALQDQIAIRPITFQTHGFIGELNDVVPASLQAVKTVADKLTFISAYAPNISVTAINAYNEAFRLYQVAQSLANSGVQAWSSITGQGGESVIDSSGLISQPNQTKQQIAFQQFYGYFQNRTLFTIQTPWAVLTNMAIESLRAVQDDKTELVTDFEIQFKQMRFSSTLVVNSGSAFQGRAAQQAGGVTDMGTQTPPTANVTFSDSLTAVA